MGRCRVLAERRQELAAAPVVQRRPPAGRAFVAMHSPFLRKRTSRMSHPTTRATGTATWLDRPGGETAHSDRSRRERAATFCRVLVPAFLLGSRGEPVLPSSNEPTERAETPSRRESARSRGQVSEAAISLTCDQELTASAQPCVAARSSLFGGSLFVSRRAVARE